MMSVKLEKDIKIEPNDAERKDPTSFLPEEAMTYEIKKKKKKKKKMKQEDPFKDIEEKVIKSVIVERDYTPCLDPEVNIKVENIEVELDINDFTNDGNLLINGSQSEDSQEPEVKIEQRNHEAAILTFENVINNDRSVIGYSDGLTTKTAQGTVCKCKICHLVFLSPKTLRTHETRKHKIYRRTFSHICDYCGMSYDQKNSLIAHIKRKHGPNAEPEDNEERTCDVCALVFKGMARLRMHMRRKHGSFEESFKHICSQCGLTYDKQRSLIVHVQRKHSNNRKIEENLWFNCPFCPKVFSKRETYVRHIQRKHNVNEGQNKTGLENLLENCRNEQTGEITCKECPLVFSSVNFLKLHMRRKHNALRDDFRLKCRICNLSYDKIESLKRHIRRKHNSGSHCNVCNKQFDSKELYLNHSHSKVIKECSLCGLIFASQISLSKHLRCIHKVDSPKKVFCNICNEGFYDRRQLRPHFMKVHLQVSYTCKYCKKTFKAKESYRRHILVKHPEDDQNQRTQNCEQCTESFYDELELCRHINMVHVNQLTTEVQNELVQIKKEEVDLSHLFQCTKCPEGYSSWEELRSHYEMNHYTIEKAQCQICGQITPVLGLSQHIKDHHNAELKCKYCDFNTKTRASLTQHMLRHMNATTLHCDSSGCRYKTFYEGAMEKHKRKHLDQGLKLQCSQCPFQSMNKYILKYHEEAHMTGKKRYVCDQCDYATILPANLVQHKYKHSTEKRFKCEVCPFATKYNTSLRFHVKKKHCDLPTLS